MSNTNVTLKVNSYQTKNTVLFDGNFINSNNKTLYCRKRPVLSCLNEFFNDVYSERNEKFFLKVQGNLFEQALLQFEASQRSTVCGFSAGPTTIAWSTLERLQYLQAALGAEAKTYEVSLACAGNVSVSMPAYPLVRFLGNPNSSRLVISDDIEVIKDILDENLCEPVAFLVGGASCIYKKTYIIGCTMDTMQELVQCYLETQYINPFVGKLASQLQDRVDARTTPEAFLLDAIEPYYYLDTAHQELHLFQGDRATLGIHSVSMADYGIVLDAESDLSRLTSTMGSKPAIADSTIPVLIVDSADLRSIEAVENGQCSLNYFFDDRTPIFTVTVHVSPHIYINSIHSEIQYEGKRVSRWKLGYAYDIATEYFPANAEDQNEIRYSSSNPEIAVVSGNAVRVLKEGAFDLIVTTRNLSERFAYVISNAEVKDIAVKGWPKDNTLYVDSQFEATVRIEPYNANWSGFTYEVIEGAKCIAVVSNGPDITITAQKAGKCVIRFTSLDNPQCSCTKTLYTEHQTKRLGLAIPGIIFGVLAILCLIIAVSSKNLDDFIFATLFLVPSLCFLVCSCLNHESLSGALLFLFAFLFSILILAFILYDGTSSDIPGENLTTGGASSLQTDPTNVPAATMLSNNDLQELINESKMLIATSTYSGSLEELFGTWTPSSSSYSGYFVRDAHNVIYMGRNIDLIFEVHLTSPESSEMETLCAVVEYEARQDSHNRICDIDLESSDLKWYLAKEDWLANIDLDDFYETSYSMDEIAGMYGWDIYLMDKADIEHSDAQALMARGYDMLSQAHENIAFDSACLYVTTDKFSAVRNELYIYFTQTQEFEDGTTVTYYFPLHASNLKVITDENGNTSLDLDSVVLTEEDYLTKLPANRGWLPLQWAE